MRDPKRIDRIVEILRAKWKTYPDMRLGQLLVILSEGGSDLFYMEDHVLEARLKDSTK